MEFAKLQLASALQVCAHAEQIYVRVCPFYGDFPTTCVESIFNVFSDSIYIPNCGLIWVHSCSRSARLFWRLDSAQTSHLVHFRALSVSRRFTIHNCFVDWCLKRTGRESVLNSFEPVRSHAIVRACVRPQSKGVFRFLDSPIDIRKQISMNFQWINLTLA